MKEDVAGDATGLKLYLDLSQAANEGDAAAQKLLFESFPEAYAANVMNIAESLTSLMELIGELPPEQKRKLSVIHNRLRKQLQYLEVI